MSVNIFGGSPQVQHSDVNSDQKFKTLSSNIALKANKSGDTITGDLKIVMNGDKERTFGVDNIASGQSVSLLLGNGSNQIRHNYGHPLKIGAQNGTKFTCPVDEVCQMGSQTDARALFFKDIIMNNNSITSLREPEGGQDAATKSYVDSRKCYNAYIPILEANQSRLGFSVSSSSNTSPKFQPFGAFNNLNADGSNGSWVAPGTTGWLQIKCPEQVTIWRVALKARNMPGRDITTWNLSASNDGTTFTTLLTSDTTLIGAASVPAFFEITANGAYQYYRLNITSSTNTASNDFGIQVFQLYIQ